MTRQDYEAIATILNDRRSLRAGASQQTVKAIAEDLVKVFEADNPRFNADTFLKASGVKR